MMNYALHDDCHCRECFACYFPAKVLFWEIGQVAQILLFCADLVELIGEEFDSFHVARAIRYGDGFHVARAIQRGGVR